MLFSKLLFCLPFLLFPFLVFTLETAEIPNETDCDTNCSTNESLHFRRANSISLGPEFYRINRKKAGGTAQKGNAIGIRATYDRIKRYHFYLGAQLFYGSGVLHGHASSGDKIRSKLTDQLIEGNVGYTFQAKCFPHVSFTPFAGYGFFKEENKFTPPTVLQIKLKTQFRYISFGFLSSVYVLPCFTVGINARFKWPWQNRCKVTDDPEFDTIRQIVKDELQYRIEVPFTYFGCFLPRSFEVSLVPFFERRLYGARENFPFDFFKTKLTIYGANLQLIYRF